jgi:hypothetical protein
MNFQQIQEEIKAIKILDEELYIRKKKVSQMLYDLTEAKENEDIKIEMPYLVSIPTIEKLRKTGIRIKLVNHFQAKMDKIQPREFYELEPTLKFAPLPEVVEEEEDPAPLPEVVEEKKEPQSADYVEFWRNIEEEERKEEERKEEPQVLNPRINGEYFTWLHTETDELEINDIIQHRQHRWDDITYCIITRETNTRYYFKEIKPDSTTKARSPDGWEETITYEYSRNGETEQKEKFMKKKDKYYILDVDFDKWKEEKNNNYLN